MVLSTQLIGGMLLSAVAASPLIQQRQSIPVGQVIFSCTQPGTMALTFDDGPFAYTSQVLDKLDAAGAKGTFFVNGRNYGSITDYAGVVQRMVNSGHQVGSHT
jgi:peptidoglycan/xylan/chitin deacetylase (PgdA/CDA1 family)